MASKPHGFPQPETFEEKYLDHDGASEDHDSSSSLLPSMEEDGRSLEKSHQQRRLVFIWIGQAAFFIFSLSMLVYSLYLQKQMPRDCTRKLSSPSPALEALTDDDYEWVRWNTTLNTFGEYTGNYTEEKAKAWLDITASKFGRTPAQVVRVTTFTVHRSTYHCFFLTDLALAPVITVSEADMIKAGASLDSVRVPESAGGGYLAQLEGFHDLHCLRVLWYDHHADEIPETKKSKLENSRHYEAHYEHCVDLLRQNLMCHFDTSFATFNWLVDIDEPFPFFANPKKCRKMDKLIDWAHEHKFHKPEGFTWKAPDDAHLVRVVDRVAQWDEPRVDKDGNELPSMKTMQPLV
ncbi:tat pathway signal sequence protein [Rutstroemia sp. NJR-2017a WRK4]|nr:tat pathway signal sequence protein [Rutstroemia sp. NJR-2017a WRK4]